MAAHINDEVEGSVTQENAKVDLRTSNQTSHNTLGDMGPKMGTNINETPILTFGGRKFTTMASGLGSEYLNKLVEELKAIYGNEQNAAGYKPTVTYLDREVKTNLAYSVVIVSLAKNNKVAYFLMVLEGTGRKPLDAPTVMQELNAATRMNQPQRSNEVYVTSDAVDSVLFNEVLGRLKVVHGEKYKFYSVDSAVIPWYNTDLSPATVRPLASLAYNACLVESGKLNQEFRDLNIAAAIEENPRAYLKIDSNMLPTVTKDAVGKAHRADWQMELNSVDNSNQNMSLNLQNNKTTICKSSGFVDAMPEEQPMQTAPGLAPTSILRFRPHIIIDRMDVDMPTTGYALLALVTSVVMVRPAMWLAAVAPKSVDKYHDAGKLNIITNIANEASGIGAALDLKDPQLKANEVYAILKQMYSLNPVCSMDIELCGATTNFTSVFATAAAAVTNNEDAAKKKNASKEIIATANWLTNGAFPLDFDLNRIFLSTGVLVPTGTWNDKNGDVRDIKDVDLSFVAEFGQSVELINKWALSNAPYSVSGLDPYVTKVDIISKLIPNAEIQGKSLRVTFSADFLSTLANACASAGLETRYDPEVTYTEQSSISVLGSYLGAAAIGQQTADFARAFNGGVNYQTPFSMGGFNRFN